MKHLTELLHLVLVVAFTSVHSVWLMHFIPVNYLLILVISSATLLCFAHVWFRTAFMYLLYIGSMYQVVRIHATSGEMLVWMIVSLLTLVGCAYVVFTEGMEEP